MERDYIENLRVAACVRNNSVSIQDLEVLQIKYDLTDVEVNEMVKYCKENGIKIFGEVENLGNIEQRGIKNNTRPHRSLTDEEKQYHQLARDIASCLVRLGINRTRKSTNDMIGFCGTYTGAIRDGRARVVRSMFSFEQLQFIKKHLPEPENLGDDVIIALKDPLEQELCDELSQQLNALIPRVGARILFRTEEDAEEIKEEGVV